MTDGKKRSLTPEDLRVLAQRAPNLVDCPACVVCPCCKGLHRVTPERADEAKREEGIVP